MIANPVAIHPLFDPFGGIILALPTGLIESLVVLLALQMPKASVKTGSLFASVIMINLLTGPLTGIAAILLLPLNRTVAILVAELIPFALEPVVLRSSLGRLRKTGRLVGEIPMRRIVVATAAANVVSFALGLLAFGLPPGIASHTRDRGRQKQCAFNLKEIGTAINMYATTHGTPLNPTSPVVTEVFRQAGISAETSNRLLHCPLDDENADSNTLCYTVNIRPLPAAGEGDPSRFPVAWDRKPFHRDSRNILFLDGHVELFSEKDFQKLFSGKKER